MQVQSNSRYESGIDEKEWFHNSISHKLSYN